MTTKRERIRHSTTRITPRAIELFQRMRDLDERSEERRDLYHQLHDELKAYPWEWPCVAKPGQGFRDAEALWRELEEASRPRPTLVERDDNEDEEKPDTKESV